MTAQRDSTVENEDTRDTRPEGARGSRRTSTGEDSGKKIKEKKRKERKERDSKAKTPRKKSKANKTPKSKADKTPKSKADKTDVKGKRSRAEADLADDSNTKDKKLDRALFDDDTDTELGFDDRAAAKELAKRQATIPKLPASVLAEIRKDPARVFESFEVQVHGVHPALWFQAFVGSMPAQLLTVPQLQQLRLDNPDQINCYKALKDLVMSTYVNVDAHREARRKFENEKMDPAYGPMEFAQRLQSQRAICDSLPKCDVNDDTQRDVFIRGLPPALAERLLEKSKTAKADFKRLVEMAQTSWVNLNSAGILRKDRADLRLAETGSVSDNLLAQLQAMSSRERAKVSKLLFGDKSKRPREYPKYEGDRSKLIASFKSNYTPEVWKQREELLKSGKRIGKEHDKCFELDKFEGKFVCIQCFKLNHSASRCTSRRRPKRD